MAESQWYTDWRYEELWGAIRVGLYSAQARIARPRQGNQDIGAIEQNFGKFNWRIKK